MPAGSRRVRGQEPSRRAWLPSQDTRGHRCGGGNDAGNIHPAKAVIAGLSTHCQARVEFTGLVQDVTGARWVIAECRKGSCLAEMKRFLSQAVGNTKQRKYI